MGKVRADDGGGGGGRGAVYEACVECTRVCQTTHGQGLPHCVPRFFKVIAEYSTAASENCHLQVPAAYIRTHIGVTKRDRYILESAPGYEWAVGFNSVGFKAGWKEFATDFQLEKGDGILFSLVSPKKFYVIVFNKFGVEKASTKQPVVGNNNVRDGQRVSNSTSGNDVLLREGRSNGGDGPGEVAKDAGRMNGQIGNHEKKAVDDQDIELSQSSDDSEDSLQVRLAKSILAEAKKKKLKKLKVSCTSTPQVEAPAVEPLSRDQPCTLNGCNANGTSSLSRDVDDGTASAGEAMFENTCQQPGVSNVDQPNLVIETEAEASKDVDEGIPDVQKPLEEEEIPVPNQRLNETTGATTEEGLLLRRDDEPVVPAKDRPCPPLFLPGLVKLEPDLSPGSKDLEPHQSCVTCTNCGLRKDLTSTTRKKSLDRPIILKSEPVTTESPDLPTSPEMARTPSSNVPPRVTEHQKQRAIALGKELSTKIANPNALLIMRSCVNPDNLDCFLSVKCSEMLPSKPTELILLDTDGNTQRAHWEPLKRCLTGPGWNDFVESHNLRIDEVWVMEIIDSSEHNFVVKVHILHAHKMEHAPEPTQIPVALKSPTNPVPAAAPKIASPAPTPIPDLGTPTPVLETPTPTPVLGTPAAKTRSSNLLHGFLSPPRTSKRTRTPPDHFQPGATTYDDRMLIELTKRSPVKRLKRGSMSSVPSTPTSGTGEALKIKPSSQANSTRKGEELKPSPQANPKKKGEEAKPSPPARPKTKVKKSAPRQGIYTPHAQKQATETEERTPEAVRQGRGGEGSQSASKLHLRSSTTDESENPNASNSNSKQVRTRNSQKPHYRVARMIDRRKSLQGVVFLVELTEKVSPQKKMKAQQDEKGRWWVPHHHFNKDLSSCYIE